jgi:hypothetical protein
MEGFAALLEQTSVDIHQQLKIVSDERTHLTKLKAESKLNPAMLELKLF